MGPYAGQINRASDGGVGPNTDGAAAAGAGAGSGAVLGSGNLPGSPEILTVSQLNNRARTMLERQFTAVWVSGEISNLKRDATGHLWFCLKDQGALLACVMFRRDAQALKAPLKDGAQVLACGRLTIYPQSGRYQLVASRLELRGAGALQAAFEALKARLQAEGLFAPGRKRALPYLPRRVAVVSSPTGAVIRDIVHVATRRFPNASLLLVPCRVQGADSVPDILKAMAKVAALAEQGLIDGVICARGGGSLEDLWAFNDEQVARAIHACPVPVVSAVGHETDFTIADFVADLRAPTPSAAAELVFPVKSELTFQLERLLGRANRAVRQFLAKQRYRLRALRAELGDGKSQLLQMQQLLAAQLERLSTGLRRRLVQRRRYLDQVVRRLHSLHPQVRLTKLRSRLEALDGNLYRTAPRQLLLRRQRLHALMQRLDALSPLAVLGRGYSIALTADEKAVRNSAQVAVGDALRLRLCRGEVVVRVEATNTQQLNQER